MLSLVRYSLNFAMLFQSYLESRKYGNSFHDDLWKAMDDVSTYFIAHLDDSCI